MPTATEFATILGADSESVTEMLCKRVLDQESSLYIAIRDELVAKIASIEAVTAAEKKKTPRPRVYIQHAVPDAGRHRLITDFPESDIHFRGSDKRSGATAIATYQLAVEHMISMSRINKGTVLLYGCELVTQIMRNRFWTHLCIPAHNPKVQVDCVRQEQNLFAIARKRDNAKAPPSASAKLLTQYTAGEVDHIRCFTPTACKVQGKVMFFSMHATDAPYRQVAYTMRQHGVQLAYMSLPANVHTEEMSEGAFPELDAYVVPTDGKYITITYENAPHLDHTWLYSNYLELLARTTVILDGVTYLKEFFDRRNGVNMYKITANQGEYVDNIPYRSWPKHDYADYYKVFAPKLVGGYPADDPRAWVMHSFPVARDIVDKVVSHAQSIEDAKDLYKDIKIRLTSATSTYFLEGDVVLPRATMSVDDFEMTAFAIYMQVVVNKYKTGKSVSALTPYIRQAALLSDMSVGELIVPYVATIVANVIRFLDVVSLAMRAMFDAVSSEATGLLPAIHAYPGYTEYSDTVSTNPLFTGWAQPQFSGSFGFSPDLPGMRLDTTFYTDKKRHEIPDTVDVDYTDLMVMGEAFLDEKGETKFSEAATLMQIALKLPNALNSAIGDVVNTLSDLEIPKETMVTTRPMPVGKKSTMTAGQQTELLFGMKEQIGRQRANVDQIKTLAADVMRGQDAVAVGHRIYYEPFSNGAQGPPDIVTGYKSTQPLQDFVDAFGIVFPEAQMMSVRYMESEKAYSDFNAVLKVIRGRIDVSRLEHMSPDAIFLPKVEGFLMPNTKTTTVNTLFAFAKRNGQTPADADSVDIEYLWTMVWKALLQVFYVENAERKMQAMETIIPNFESQEEWLSKLDVTKRNKLEDQDFHFDSIKKDAHYTQYMLKGKSKPIMSRDYASSLKQPQTIQFDPTGRSVAVFSPLIAQLVDREQELLKPNVMVMQRKNLDQINGFLNNFDHRVDNQGRQRLYLEIDFSQFDKSQNHVVAALYIRIIKKLGIEMSYAEFIVAFQYERWCSAVTAGMMFKLIDQNMSGAAFTLDRNNRVCMAALSMVFLEMVKELVDIEFIMTQGDDNCTAVRGMPNVSSWESDLNRTFNLTLKVTVSPYGYMSSMYIAHLPDGRSRAVADPLKRALTFTEVSVRDEALFHEKFVSYGDNTFGLHDLHVQNYLAIAVVERMRSALPTITAEAVMLLIGVVCATRSDEKQFRGMFAPEAFIVNH